MAAGGSGDASRRGTTLPSAHDEPLSTISGGSSEAASPLGKGPHWAQAHPCFLLAVQLQPSFRRQAWSRVFAGERRALRKVRLKVPHLGRKAGDARASRELEEPRPACGPAREPQPPQTEGLPLARRRPSASRPRAGIFCRDRCFRLWTRPGRLCCGHSLSASARGDVSSGEHATPNQGAGPLGSRPGGHWLAHGITAPVGP